jgi:aminoglycoside phosphotransferase (APT) family kinase protein
VLLHGDFWPENLLWKDGRITAVLDWEDAALGDPHADLAGARLELALAHDEAAAESFTRAYAARRPLDPGRLPLWELYVSSAMLHFLGGWGLPPERERVLRDRARRFLERAARRIAVAGERP